MELLLNLAWLVLAVAGAVSMLGRVQRESQFRDVWLIATAMLCIMVLLFPVISMTDDLHAEAYLAEESGKRNVVVMQMHHHLNNVESLAVRPASLMVLRSWPGWFWHSEPVLPCPLEGTCNFPSTRPPPIVVPA